MLALQAAVGALGKVVASSSAPWWQCHLQTLKMIRYTARLLAATTSPNSVQNQRFSALEKSIGVSRKVCSMPRTLSLYHSWTKVVLNSTAPAQNATKLLKLRL